MDVTNQQIQLTKLYSSKLDNSVLNAVKTSRLLALGVKSTGLEVFALFTLTFCCNSQIQTSASHYSTDSVTDLPEEKDHSSVRYSILFYFV